MESLLLGSALPFRPMPSPVEHHLLVILSILSYPILSVHSLIHDEKRLLSSFSEKSARAELSIRHDVQVGDKHLSDYSMHREKTRIGLGSAVVVMEPKLSRRGFAWGTHPSAPNRGFNGCFFLERTCRNDLWIFHFPYESIDP